MGFVMVLVGNQQLGRMGQVAHYFNYRELELMY